MTLWTIYRQDSGELVYRCFESGEAPIGDGFPWDAATIAAREIEGDPVDAIVAWDAETRSWVDDLPRLRDLRRAEAEAYCQQRRTSPLLVTGIAETTIVAKRDADGQAWIDRFTTAAMGSLLTQQPFAITFTDANGARVTLNAQQILALGQASLTQQALCQAALDDVYAALDLAGSAAEIAAVDVTAGYPA